MTLPRRPNAALAALTKARRRSSRAASLSNKDTAAPALLLGGLVSFGLDLSGVGRWAGLPLVLANVVWLRFWAEGLAAAHGFRSGLIIFAVMAGLAAALTLAAPGVMATP